MALSLAWQLVIAANERPPEHDLVGAFGSRSGLEGDHFARLTSGEDAATRPGEKLVGERRFEFANARAELRHRVF